ncbi:MAG: FecR family protein [Prolixibacteraceae bacterium]|nr:FecR family protein [Prolixibacteraceae bacterium]
MKFSNNSVTEIEKRKLALRIKKKLEIVDQKKKRILVIGNFLKYAAVALLFFSIGSGLVYLYMDNRQPNIVAENPGIKINAQEPILIIDDKKQIQLNHGESTLDYSQKGEIIVDDQHTLNKKNKGKVPEMNNLVIPYGNRSVITLADGSRVWLNAGSRLIYPSEFLNKKREVFLVGEAYFEVKKNETQPFVVKTNDIEVNVLGTKFNVSAYPEDYAVQTVLAEGKVEINLMSEGKLNNQVNLIPGQMAYYNKKTKDTRIYNVEVEEYTLWTQGLFSFSNTDFNRIVKKLERFYNIHFQFDDPLKGTIQITGKLDVNQERTEVLEYLTKLTGLKIIKINESQYLIK